MRRSRTTPSDARLAGGAARAGSRCLRAAALALVALASGCAGFALGVARERAHAAWPCAWGSADAPAISSRGSAGVVTVARAAATSPPAPRDDDSTAAADVVRDVLAHHVEEDNPRNRAQRAYTYGGCEALSPGQVGLLPVGGRTIQFCQIPNPSGPPRTYSITVD